MILRRKRLIAIKTETTPGTAVSLANADAIFNAFDPVIQPTAAFIPRLAQGSAGQLAGVVGLPTGTVNFRTELYGNGLGTKTDWADILFPACAVVNTTGNTFAPTTAAPGAAVKTVTIGMYQDGLFKSLRGAVGNLTITAVPGEPVYLDWAFTGAWVTPTDVGMLTPTFPTRRPIQARQGTTTIGATAMCYSSLTLDLGNVITPRQCVNAEGGLHSMIITDRNITGTLDPEARRVTDYPVYGDWINSTVKALSASFGDVDDTFIIASNGFQISNAQEGDRSGLQTDTISFQLVKGNAPDSELTFLFDET